MATVKEIRDLFARLVQRGPDDMRRRLVIVDLQYVFAEIRLDDGESRGLDGVIERRLLRDHRFRFDDLPHIMTTRDLEHERVDVCRRLRKQHGCAIRARVLLENPEPYVEVIENALPYHATCLARPFEVVELRQ